MALVCDVDVVFLRMMGRQTVMEEVAAVLMCTTF